MRPTAKKNDWKTEPMPEKQESFILKRHFTDKELEALRHGHIPQEMEDKWFWYCEDGKLYAHRSWTGFCIYVIELHPETDEHKVTVNRDPDQYKPHDAEEEKESLNNLLDWWTQSSYDYYNEWLEETVKALEKAKQGRSTEAPVKAEQRIALFQGDITKIAADAIVNAANKSLLGGGGVDGAIHRAAGPGLLAECRTLNGCNTGEAKITKGYDLPAQYVIHTVGPIYSGRPSDAELLAACYRNSLELARANGIQSIAFPSISTGVYGYPADEAADVAIAAVKNWFSENGDYAIDVVFCVFDDRTERIYRQKL